MGETTVREIVRERWNCSKATEIHEKTEDDSVNIANDFYRRMQFPNDEKHIGIKMVAGSGYLFYN